MKIRKLPARSAVFLLPFIVSIFMSCIVSGISTLRTIGWDDGFLSAWMTSWAMSWPIEFPILLLIMPLARKIVASLVEPV